MCPIVNQIFAQISQNFGKTVSSCFLYRSETSAKIFLRSFEMGQDCKNWLMVIFGDLDTISTFLFQQTKLAELFPYPAEISTIIISSQKWVFKLYLIFLMWAYSYAKWKNITVPYPSFLYCPHFYVSDNLPVGLFWRRLKCEWPAVFTYFPQLWLKTILCASSMLRKSSANVLLFTQIITNHKIDSKLFLVGRMGDLSAGFKW